MEPAGIKDRNHLPPTSAVCKSTMNENNVFHGLLLRLCVTNAGKSAGNYHASGKEIFSDLHCHPSPNLTVDLLADYDLLVESLVRRLQTGTKKYRSCCLPVPPIQMLLR